jgi:hypothetical protein
MMIHSLDESAMDFDDEDSPEAIEEGKAIDAWDEEMKARGLLVGGGRLLRSRSRA